MNELQFTARVTQWIAIILDGNPSLPYSRADIEEKLKGSQKRRDLTLHDNNGNVVLTGEVKLPFSPEGQSPFNDELVADARKKARAAKSRFFFTWNVNEFVLWQTEPSEPPLAGSHYERWDTAAVHFEHDLELPSVERKLKDWLRDFLYKFRQILKSEVRVSLKSPDEKFTETIESYLNLPIEQTYHALRNIYADGAQKNRLDGWMMDDLGWIVSDDPEDIAYQLRRAARFACYALVNRLVFHEALLKRHGAKMAALSVPGHITTGEELRLHFAGLFAEAVIATGDYETVFGEERHSYGDTVPFKSDASVESWRRLITQIHQFDFSKLDYELIGNIFERLIAPEERRKYGQYYTRVEVVDLINSFCIIRGDELVMDPACGGGTFLVRAYARKRELKPERKHVERLNDLFGVDIERFAAHLSTINLATRDLVGAENYPQIKRSDFFDIRPGGKFMRLPVHGGDNSEHRNVTVSALDAVVGNPPYIRQEMIDKSRKKRYQALVQKEQGVKLSGRSDIHVYFWLHSASFLKDDGYLCLITSSQWLDVEYGFKLQKWILENFRIIAVFESIEEPWFEGARVATAVTILQKEPDKEKRMSNTVRFVQLRRPIKEVMMHNGSAAEAVFAANSFRDEILDLSENTVNERYRARLVRQGELYEDGVKLGAVMSKSGVDDEEEEQDEVAPQAGEYYGGKWGLHLRAPDLWFELLDELEERLVPLGEIADVRFGVKSGKDEFFFPIDCSKDMLAKEQNAKEFKERFGVPREEVASGEVKLVRCGPGRRQVKPIEAKYLEPEVHSPLQVSKYAVTAEDCPYSILLAPSKSRLEKYCHQYVEWGEKQRYAEGSTCASRAVGGRKWYDITGRARAPILWPMAQQYKHVVPQNVDSLICNKRYYEVDVSDDTHVYAGVLNSTVVLLSKYQFGRPVGVEGHLDTEVLDVKMMLVPDPRKATKTQQQRVARAFRKLAKRDAYQFLSEKRLRRQAYMQKGKQAKLDGLSDLSELDMADRRELDDAVLQMLGVRDKARRDELIERLYAYLRQFFEDVRQKEERAIENKKRAKRKGGATAPEVAKQILDDIELNYRWILQTYRDFLSDIMPNVDTIVVPKDATARGPEEILNGFRVAFKIGRAKNGEIIELPYEAQAKLIVLLAQQGFHKYVRIPHYEKDAKKVLLNYSEFLRKRDRKLTELVEERTTNEERQEKIMAALKRLIPR
ncbi:N-6 DNA methylase [bacterium]|nr:N-6 DNA methylase [bacterium]